jgi:hypothetical protein
MQSLTTHLPLAVSNKEICGAATRCLQLTQVAVYRREPLFGSLFGLGIIPIMYRLLWETQFCPVNCFFSRNSDFSDTDFVP